MIRGFLGGLSDLQRGSPVRVGRLRVACTVLLALAAVGPCVAAVGAEDDPTEYRTWRPVSPADWAVEADETRGIEHAVVLYDGTIIDDRTASADRALVSHYRRVRVLDETGVAAHRTLSIRLDPGQYVDWIHARTLKPGGREIAAPEEEIRERRPLSRGRRGRTEFVVSFPEAAAGDILECRYALETEWPSVPRICFRSRTHTLSSELIWWYRPPQPQDVTAIENAEQVWMPAFALTNCGGLDSRVEQLPSREAPVRLKVSFRDVPPLPDDPFQPADEEISACFAGWYKFPGLDRERPYWRRVAEEWGRQERPLASRSAQLDRWMASILAGPRDLDTDLRSCFDLLHRDIRNSDLLPARDRPEKPPGHEDAADVLQEGRGDSDALNATYLGMLRRLGVKASLFWIRDREQGSFFPQWENANQFTMGGVVVRAPEGLRWFFPALPYARPGALPWAATECEALIAETRPDGKMGLFPLFEVTPPADSASNRCDLAVRVTLDKTGTVAGRLRARWSCPSDGEFAWRLQRESSEEAARLLRTRALPEDLDWTVSEETYAVDDSGITYACSLEVAGIAQPAGDRFLVEPGRLHMDDYRIPARRRTCQIHFPYPIILRSEVRMALPPGLRLQICPPPGRIDREYARFGLTCAIEADTVVLRRDFDLVYNIYRPEAADSLRFLFERMNDAGRQPLLLVPADR